MRRTFPALPVEPTEPALPLSQRGKGRHALGRTLNPTPFLCYNEENPIFMIS